METPETRAKLANAIQTLRSQGREAEVQNLVNAYKAKYRPEVPTSNEATGIVGFGKGVLQGAGETLQNIGNATLALPKKVLGLQDVKTGINPEAFVPKTTSQQVGKTVERVAEFLAPQMKIAKVTSALPTVARIATRTVPDVGLALAQSGGDIKAGGVAGVTSAVGDALLGGKVGTINTLGKALKQIGKTTATGYTSDVAGGVAGMRGEDRTGAKAFIPGAGTALSFGLGTALTGVQGYRNLKNPDIETINNAKRELEDSYVKFYGGTQAGKKKIDKALFAQEMKNKAGTSGYAPHQILADDGIIPEVKGNQFDTFEQAKQYKEKTIKMAQQGKKILKEVELQTPPVRLADLEQEAISRANTQQNIDSGDAEDLIRNIRKEFAKLKRAYGETIPLSKLDEIKSARWTKIDFSKQNPFAPRVDKLSSDADYIIAKSAQKRIEDIATQAGLDDVAQFNRDIGDRLESARFLADLNGKTLKGSFTTRMASRIIGASAGTSLPGSIIGAIGGDFVANMLISNSVISPTKRLILRNIYEKNPQSYEKVMEWLTKQGFDRDVRLALPEPSAIYVPPTKQAPTSETLVVGGNRPPVSFEQAQKRAGGLPEYGGLYEYNQAKEATQKAVGRSVLPSKFANKGTSVKRTPAVPASAKIEDVSQYSLPKATSMADAISTPNMIVIPKSITIPKGSSIDQTRAIVNNHLKTSLEAIADPDTYDMIMANPKAFYKQQIQDIAMGLKAENPKYARLANSITSIDVNKVNSFEDFAGKIREKLAQKTLWEKVSGKGLPNRQGGFIKNPLANTSLVNEAKKYKSAEEFVKASNTTNPTGKVFVDYTPKQRAKMPVGDGLQPLSKSLGESPDELITIYRGSPVNQKDIVAGDFITTNKQLAKDYAGTGKVLEKRVRKGDILDVVDEVLGEEYLYRPNADKEKIYTKSQLEQIWKEANKKSALPKRKK